MKEPISAEDRPRRSAVIDWMERHLGEDFKLNEWQRRILEDIYYYEHLSAEHRQPLIRNRHHTIVPPYYVPPPDKPGRPIFQWLGPDHLLVLPEERPTVDYYKSAPWVSNTETLRRYITEWSGA